MNEKDIKNKLTAEQYHVAREKGTEMPFSGKYVHETKDGIYACVVCGNPLFSSQAKYDSGSGWPSFDEALPGAVKMRPDLDGGLSRTEVICAKCGSHLGHLFDDGPTKTGKRFCLNSICLDLDPNQK